MSTSRLLRALADLAPATKPATYDHLGAKTAWGTGFDAVEGGGALESYDELHRDERPSASRRPGRAAVAVLAEARKG